MLTRKACRSGTAGLCRTNGARLPLCGCQPASAAAMPPRQGARPLPRPVRYPRRPCSLRGGAPTTCRVSTARSAAGQAARPGLSELAEYPRTWQLHRAESDARHGCVPQNIAPRAHWSASRGRGSLGSEVRRHQGERLSPGSGDSADGRYQPTAAVDLARVVPPRSDPGPEAWRRCCGCGC
jgi:hypothetical protein